MTYLKKIIEILAKIQILFSPILLFSFFGVISYMYFDSVFGIILLIFFILSGIILGIFFLRNSLKNESAVKFMSRVNASPDVP
ncbi:MAG: hypothetical protein IPQ23_11365 [Cytophagaceae bacterium]|nr:hypothetical protein [Cytophagaceae bacterium]